MGASQCCAIGLSDNGGPICRVLPIAPATFYRHAAIARRPELASDRARQDVQDFEKIEATHGKSRGRYGARKVWHQLRRDGHDIARCTVERLMHLHGLQGAVRGQKKTTIPDPAQPCPDDKVNRQFVATMPDQLWVSDFASRTFGSPMFRHGWAWSTWLSSSMSSRALAIVLEPMAHQWLAVGWRVSTSMTTGFVLDALNQAVAQRCPAEGGGLIHHSDRGSQYLSIRYTERLADAGIDTSVGSVGDSYDNALAESVIGLFKTEVINFLGPWKSMAQVEWETLHWVSWYNTERLHSAIGHRPPQEVEDEFHAETNTFENAAQVLNRKASRKPGTVQSAVPNGPQHRPCHEQGPPPRANVIIGDRTRARSHGHVV